MVESSGRKKAPVVFGMKDARVPIREASSLSGCPLITLRTYGYICTANCLLTSGPSGVHTIYSFKKQIRFLLHPKIRMVEKGMVRIHRLFLGPALLTVFSCAQASSAHLNQNMGPDIKSFKPQAIGSPCRYLKDGTFQSTRGNHFLFPPHSIASRPCLADSNKNMLGWLKQKLKTTEEWCQQDSRMESHDNHTLTEMLV